MLGRIVIDDVRPRTPGGSFPAKAVSGERLVVSADIYRDGHDLIAARACIRPAGTKGWTYAVMSEAGNDRWEAVVVPATLGRHEIAVEAWTDGYATWRHKATTKLGAGQDIDVELEEGALLLEARAAAVAKKLRGPLETTAAALRDETVAPWERLRVALEPEIAALLNGPGTAAEITRSTPLPLWVDRERAQIGAWYEFFPRSEGGLRAAEKRLDGVASMGFDVVYLPPIHPIGRTARKGAGNTTTADPDDPGSPWAIGGPEGGHTAVHPDLGTLDDFDSFVSRAEELGLEVALDYALQCSPDHPWVSEHPEWFHHRPDGSIAYAENPPKKYQDIFPINFWPDTEADRLALWDACLGILQFWIARGVRIFRVDNPHTKPMAFWAWLIPAVQRDHPEVVLLAEAFTRPKVMAKLAEVGFSQSYTYFTWRTERWELEEYLAELTEPPLADYFRPNFWPNTPDILAAPLRNGPPAAFKLRLVLAALLSPSYGMYSGYEHCENEPQSDVNEEYHASEKYEMKERDWSREDSLAPFISIINDVRRRHPATRQLRNLTFHGVNNDRIIAWSKRDEDRADVLLCVVNLDPFTTHEATLQLDLEALGFTPEERVEAYDEITGRAFVWQGYHPYVRLDPFVEPAHVLHLRPLAGA